MSKNKLICTILSCLLTISSLNNISSAQVNISDSQLVKEVSLASNDSETQRIIVKYRDNKKCASIKKDLTRLLSGVKFKETKELSKIDVIEVEGKEECDLAMKLLNKDSGVEYAQPDYKLYATEYPTDKEFSNQWGIENTGQKIRSESGVKAVDINVMNAWNTVRGSKDVLVGVLDSGIDIEHEDLKNSIYFNLGEIPLNGIDDDNNGYIDDVNGWDFLNSDNSVFDDESEDKHGTHLSGIIAAEANTIGVRGVASGVKIVPLKFIGETFGFTSDAIEAIRYASKLGIKVINCSWGDTHYNYALEQEMKKSGMLFVCSTGNEKMDITKKMFYPCGYELSNILSVSAINNRGDLAVFSNFGMCVDVAAPGDGIYSTVPGNKYSFERGTSMASPFVTGTAALLLSYDKSLTAEEMVNFIKGSAKKIDGLKDKIETGGIVDADSALKLVIQKNASNESWKTKSQMPFGKSNFSLVTIKNKIYAIGYDQRVFEYDTDIDKWTEKTQLPSNITEHGLNYNGTTSVALNDKIYIMGGQDSKKLLEYDPTDGKCTEKASMNYKRENAASTVFDGKIYISGGLGDDKSSKTVEVYDIKDDKWTLIESMNEIRNSHTMAAIGNKLYVFGGVSNPKRVEAYDCEEKRWTPIGESPVDIYLAASVAFDNNIYLIGNSANDQDNFWEFKPSENSWVAKKQMPTKRDSLGAVVLNGKIYAVGGNDKVSNCTVEEYTFGKDNDQTPIPTIQPTQVPYQPLIGNERVISGRIFTDEVLNKDLAIDVYAESDSGKAFVTKVTLESGTKSKEYSIKIPEKNLHNSCRIGYYLADGCGKYANTGYYSNAGTVYDSVFADDVIMKTSDISNIEIDLITKRTISGRISLPANMTAPSGGIDVEVELFYPDYAFKDNVEKPPYIYRKVFKIPEGQNSVLYSFLVYENNDSQSYFLRYLVNSEGLLSTGYYRDNGTFAEKIMAGNIDVNYFDANNINVELLSTKYISGKISLPDGIVAPSGGMVIAIYAEVYEKNKENKENLSTYSVIEEGKSSARYFINIPDTKNSNFNLSYRIKSDNYLDFKLVKDGYLSKYPNNNSTTVYKSKAYSLNIDDKSNANVDMEIMKGNRIGGNISLSGEMNGKIEVGVFAYRLIESAGIDICAIEYKELSNNTKTQEFEFVLPDGSFSIGYFNEEYEKNGYLPMRLYSINGMVDELAKASEINIHSNEMYVGQYKLSYIKMILDNGKNTSTTPIGTQGGSLINGTQYNSGLGSVTPKNLVTPKVTVTPEATVTSKSTVTPLPSSTKTVSEPSKEVPLTYVFKDITKHWAKDNILTLAQKGVLEGYPDQTIKPDNNINRAEICKILLKMLGFEPTVNPELSFSDKNNIPNWAKGNIDILTKKGIIEGYDDNSFRALTNVTRKEMAVLIIRAIGYDCEDNKSADVFIDNKSIPKWAIGSVSRCVELGLMKGYKDKCFKPDQYITRSEAFTIITRAMEFK